VGDDFPFLNVSYHDPEVKPAQEHKEIYGQFTPDQAAAQGGRYLKCQNPFTVNGNARFTTKFSIG